MRCKPNAGNQQNVKNTCNTSKVISVPVRWPHLNNGCLVPKCVTDNGWQWVPNRICHQPQGGSETAPQRPHPLQQSASLSLHQFFSQFLQMSNLLTTWRHASLSLIRLIRLITDLSQTSLYKKRPIHFEPCTLLCPNSMHLAARSQRLFESPAKFCWMAQHSRFGSENRASQNFMDHPVIIHFSIFFQNVFFWGKPACPCMPHFQTHSFHCRCSHLKELDRGKNSASRGNFLWTSAQWTVLYDPSISIILRRWGMPGWDTIGKRQNFWGVGKCVHNLHNQNHRW